MWSTDGNRDVSDNEAEAVHVAHHPAATVGPLFTSRAAAQSALVAVACSLEPEVHPPPRLLRLPTFSVEREELRCAFSKLLRASSQPPAFQRIRSTPKGFVLCRDETVKF